MKRFWVIYDERAQAIDTDDCSVLESCRSLKDVSKSCFDGKEGPLGIVFEYDVAKGNELVNERKIGTVQDVRGRRPQEGQ